VNTRRHIKREAVLWLGLVTALAASGLLVSRRIRSADLPSPEPHQAQVAQNRTEPESSAQPLKSINDLPAAFQLTEPIPEEMQTMDPDLEGFGYEIPFLNTNPIPLTTIATRIDPEKLSAALTDAAANGDVRALAALLHSGNPAGEIEAVRILARIGGGEALAAALGKVLTVPTDNPDYNKFINAFADCHSAAVAGWLTESLGQTKVEDVRQRILTILAALRGPEVVDSLAASLASSTDETHAKDCAELLAKSSDPGQAAVLRALLETSESTDIQTSAARGLAHVGSSDACATLIEASSSDETIATACRDALATVKSSYGQEALIQAAVNPSVPSAVRCAAVQALSTQPGQRTQTVLINLAQATSDPVLLTAISQTLQTLEQSGTPPQPGSTLGDAGINGEIWF